MGVQGTIHFFFFKVQSMNDQNKMIVRYKLASKGMYRKENNSSHESSTKYNSWKEKQ